MGNVNIIKYFLMMLIPAGFLVLAIWLNVHIDDKYYDEVRSKIDDGYVLYLDGTETDPNNIYLNQYPVRNIYVDNAKKAVFVTIVEQEYPETDIEIDV